MGLIPAPDPTDRPAWHDARAAGRFRNPWPRSEPHGLRDLLRWALERRSQPQAPTPPRGSFATSAPVISYPRAATAERRATWVGHSTVLLQVGGINLITDPVFGPRAFPVQWMGPRRVMDPGLALERLPPLDLVLLSHNHYDHMDRPAIRRLAPAHSSGDETERQRSRAGEDGGSRGPSRQRRLRPHLVVEALGLRPLRA